MNTFHFFYVTMLFDLSPFTISHFKDVTSPYIENVIIDFYHEAYGLKLERFQRRIWNPIKHLCCSFLAKIVLFVLNFAIT